MRYKNLERTNNKNNYETKYWEEKVLDDLSCDELLFVENDREIRGDANQIVKIIIKMKGCKVD
ncbi:hypothetical protein J4221_02075 [Candidatus Pacearchaeota archaeon]|nr:hypothetical protein [Candidatus Pacearchaeota archaeon]